MAQGLAGLTEEDRAEWYAALAGAEPLLPNYVHHPPSSPFAESHQVEEIIYTDGTGDLARACATANGFWGLEIILQVIFGAVTLGPILFVAAKVFLNGGHWP